MLLKLLKFALSSCLMTSLFVLGGVSSYAFQSNTTNTTQGPSIKTPMVRSNSAPMQPNKGNWQNKQNKQQNNQNQTNTFSYQRHDHDHDHDHNHNSSTTYYNPGYYPYFIYPGDDDSYDYSTPSDTSPDENSDNTNTDNTNTDNTNTDNTQTSFPTYDPASLPDGAWVSDSAGNVPDKAFVFQINNGAPIYYCRVQYNYTTTYGVLTPNVGCYIQDQSAIIHFDQYDVLISQN